ncbi:MAG: class I SAM-dependent RNA methyltransferase [Candidatus Verstraetearchaeota archaeon]|nr:class I SAM-dependent RNA methyltransferase [Candidatus Verstraetearchaeota archaeon]
MPSKNFAFAATTVYGFEDLAALEVEQLLGVKAEISIGKLFFKAPLSAIYKLNIEARLLHKVILLLWRGEVSSLEEIYKAARRVDYALFIASEQSFAVRADRFGTHPFTSMDIAAAVGQAVIDSYRSSTGVRLKVNLNNPDVEILCQLRDRDFFLGINTTGESLHKRNYRVYDHPAALSSTIATALIKLSGWSERHLLMDPMCGGGTVLIEAALLARRTPPGKFRKSYAYFKLAFTSLEEHQAFFKNALKKIQQREVPLLGIDKNAEYLRGARANASSAEVSDTIDLIVADSTRLDSFLKVQPEVVVVNPPYGRRYYSPRILRKLYPLFARALSRACRGSTLVAITAAPNIFRSALKTSGIEVLEERMVIHGDLTTKVFKCAI